MNTAVSRVLESVVHQDDTSAATPRPIIYRTKGSTHGAITRLVSPNDAGRLIKPFVFLDLFKVEAGRASFGWHPHSGIATVTVLMEGEGSYEESTGAKGRLPEGGVEYMQAGNGVWHTGGTAGTRDNVGFQLWVALPPEAENGASSSQYLAPADVASVGPARVILGQYGEVTSQIRTASEMTYLDVMLKAGETWTYVPPASHSVGWIAVQQGFLESSELIRTGELVVYAPSSAPMVFTAIEDTRFVLGSAPQHAHDLVLGNYSVHSSAAALREGEAHIVQLGKTLGRAGVLR